MIIAGRQAVGTTTEFFFPVGIDGSPAGTITQKNMYIPYAGYLKFFAVQGDVAPGATHAVQVNVFKNGAVSTLTLTLGAADVTKTDNNTFLAVAAGDVVSMQQVPTGTPATTTIAVSLIYFVGPNPCG